jgi:hypothetical protein
MEPIIADSHLNTVRTLLLVAGLSFLVCVAGAMGHNAYDGLFDMEERVSLVISLVAALVFVSGSPDGMVIGIFFEETAITNIGNPGHARRRFTNRV